MKNKPIDVVNNVKKRIHKNYSRITESDIIESFLEIDIAIIEQVKKVNRKVSIALGLIIGMWIYTIIKMFN